MKSWEQWDSVESFPTEVCLAHWTYGCLNNSPYFIISSLVGGFRQFLFSTRDDGAQWRAYFSWGWNHQPPRRKNDIYRISMHHFFWTWWHAMMNHRLREITEIQTCRKVRPSSARHSFPRGRNSQAAVFGFEGSTCLHRWICWMDHWQKRSGNRTHWEKVMENHIWSCFTHLNKWGGVL